MGADERILHDVIRHLVPPRHSQGHAIDTALVGTHDFPECIIVSFTSAHHEVAIDFAGARMILNVGWAAQTSSSQFGPTEDYKGCLGLFRFIYCSEDRGAGGALYSSEKPLQKVKPGRTPRAGKGACRAPH